METTLDKRDRGVIWHPFTQAMTASSPIAFEKGKGAYLFTPEGKPYFDGISSWWVNLHGHAHPEIAQAISRQALELEHMLFTDFTHEVAVTLAERLLDVLPQNLKRVFYSDNGSTAVETALKMAIQYWHNRDLKKPLIVSFKSGHHGDTFGSMSVGGKGPFNTPFWPYLFPIEQIDPPFVGQEDLSLKQFEKILETSQAGALLFEPLVQGAGGMRIYSQEGLEALLSLAKEHEVLLIADEVMTGFGRLGPLFISNALAIKPDIICLSKGITGGFLPLGATIATQKIYDSFLSTQRTKALLHGHSYTGNLLGCAAAFKSLELLQHPDCQEKRQTIAKEHQAFVDKWSAHPKLRRLEALGTLLVLEYKSNEKTSYTHPLRDQLIDFFTKKQLILRPLGNVLYVMPPYCTTAEDLANVYEAIAQTFETTW